jgi:hypothetical protein
MSIVSVQTLELSQSKVCVAFAQQLYAIYAILTESVVRCDGHRKYYYYYYY